MLFKSLNNRTCFKGGFSYSQSVNFLNSAMEALFVEEGALTWVIVDVSLVERVDATHVSLEGES